MAGKEGAKSETGKKKRGNGKFEKKDIPGSNSQQEDRGAKRKKVAPHGEGEGGGVPRPSGLSSWREEHHLVI